MTNIKLLLNQLNKATPKEINFKDVRPVQHYLPSYMGVKRFYVVAEVDNEVLNVELPEDTNIKIQQGTANHATVGEIIAFTIDKDIERGLRKQEVDMRKTSNKRETRKQNNKRIVGELYG